jgi:hypothetical protein
VSRGPLQDWAFGSIESGDDAFGSSVTTWRAFKQEIVMVNVLSGEVRRLAHHRSRSVFSNYYYQPRVSASWDGGFVAWASNMGLDQSGYADIYSIRVDTGSGSTGGVGTSGGGGTLPALTVDFTNPSSGATVSGTVTVTASASGGSGSGYAYTVKAGTSTIYSGTNPTFSWNTTATPNGPVTLSATVTDGAGATASASRAVSVSNTVELPPPGGQTLPSGTENVVWTQLRRVTVSGNSITKSSGCNGCGDAGASSQQTITSGNGSLRFTASANASLTAGLSNLSRNTAANEIKFGLRFSPSAVEVRELGAYKARWTPLAGAVYQIAVEGDQVKYYENGTLKYTSTRKPTYPLLVDTTLNTLGAGVQNATLTK